MCCHSVGCGISDAAVCCWSCAVLHPVAAGYLVGRRGANANGRIGLANRAKRFFSSVRRAAAQRQLICDAHLAVSLSWPDFLADDHTFCYAGNLSLARTVPEACSRQSAVSAQRACTTKVNPGHSPPMRWPDSTRASRGRIRKALLCCTQAPARRLRYELSYKSRLYTLEA